LNDSAQDIFGKTMSIPDELIINYFILAAQANPQEVSEIQSRLESGENPRLIKDLLAQKIVSIYYSEDDAKKASEDFVNLFKKKEIPDNIPEYKLNGDNKLAEVMVAAGLCETKGEAKRLIQGGGVKLDGNKLDDPALELSPAHGEVLQAGKRKFVRLV